MELPLILKFSGRTKGTLPEVLDTEVNSGWHAKRFSKDLAYLERTI